MTSANVTLVFYHFTNISDLFMNKLILITFYETLVSFLKSTNLSNTIYLQKTFKRASEVLLTNIIAIIY